MSFRTIQILRYSQNNSKHAALFLGAFLTISCGNQHLLAQFGKPKWVKIGKDKELEERGLLQGFGTVRSTGKDKAEEDFEAAKNQAIADLAMKIQVRVEGRTTDTWAERFEGGRRESLSDVRSEVRTSVDLTLDEIGIRSYPEKPKKSRDYYALAFLNPDRAARKLAEKLRTLSSKIEREKTLINEAINGGRVRVALAHAVNARKKSFEAAGHAANYNVLRRETNPRLADLIQEDGSGISIEPIWVGLVHGFKIKPHGQTRFKVFENQPPKEQMVARVLLDHGGKNINGTGIPVRFDILNTDGVVQSEVKVQTRGLSEDKGSSERPTVVKADKDGLAACRILSFKLKKDKIQMVSASIDMDALVGDMTHIGDDRVRRWLSPLSELKTVYVFERPGDKELSLRQWIARRVTQLTTKSGWPKEAKILIGAFTYRDTRASGEFGRELARLFKTAMGESQIPVRNSDPSGTSPILRGEYWEDEKLVDIRVYLEDQSGEQLLAASGFIDRTKTGPHSMKPKSFDKFQENAIELADPKLRAKDDFKINVWTDRGRNPLYNNGEKMVLYLRANKECYVRLLYITSDDNVLLIYPNRYGASDKLQPGKVYQIPGKNNRFDFEIVPPYGPEILKVIASNKPLPKPKGEAIDGAILLSSHSVKSLARTLRGLTVKKRPDPQPAVQLRWDAEDQIIVNTTPR